MSAPINYTPQEQELITQWKTSEQQDLIGLQQTLGISRRELAQVNTEISIYQKKQAQAMADQDALLKAKAASYIDGFTHEVHYLTGHPTLGGTDPTKWEVRHLDNTLIPPAYVTDYSHTVAWDNNAAILHTESNWNLFQTWQTDPFFGANVRHDGLQSAFDEVQAQIIALEARNAELP